MATQRALRELNTSPRAVRSPSISSDVYSARSTATPTMPEANPPPAFVASAEASQLISSEVDESVNVKEEALSLLNAFLDHILYNILSTAKSVELARLRDAVPIVLKPRLGKAALGAADEELKEYLNDGDDDILTASYPRSDARSDFDLDLAWKLARLRCMVYTRLGDMEEEDEEDHIEAEQLNPGSGTYTNTAHRASTIKAASAIFLTSILEYLGEQTLLYAVQNTQRRAHTPTSSPIHQTMVLDESDMFYVGRESPLSRLWRSWRRQTRSPMEMTSRQISPIQDEHPFMAEKTPRIDENVSQEEIQDLGLPDQVPLPMSHNDVNEIEVPGLAREIFDEGDAQPPIPVPERSKRRPVSMILHDADARYQPALDSPRPPKINGKRRSRPELGHLRSLSHPTPGKQTFSSVPMMHSQDTTILQLAQGADYERSQQATSDILSDAAPGEIVRQPEENQKPQEGHLRTGIVANAVSTAAGVLGLGALASSKNLQDEKSVVAQPRPARSGADETIGTIPEVATPKDAIIKSSVTGLSDFDNRHIPIENPKASWLDSSDPEDLALSSGDEDAPQKPSVVPVTNETHETNGKALSQFTMPQISDTSKHTGTEDFSDPHQIPKPINRQGMILVTSQEALGKVAPAASHQENDRPVYRPLSIGSTYNVVTIPVTTSPSSTEKSRNMNVISPAYDHSDESIVRESAASRPGTATTTVQNSVPARVSSDRSRLGHTHTNSRASQYSQDSKRSSSSSKLLGFTRDQDGRPQTATSQGPVTNGAHTYTTSGPATDRKLWSDSSSSLKKSLRVGTDTKLKNKVDNVEAKEKSLEVLIHGEETLHYTLTPVSARAENFPLPEHSPTKSRNVSSRDGSNAAHQSAVSGTSNIINGLRVNPVNGVLSPSSSRPVNSAYESPTNGTASSHSTQAKPGTSRAQPRDARLDSTTMMDLADYARSTGPENETQLPKALASFPATAGTVKTLQSTTNTVRTMPAAPPTAVYRPTTQQSQGSKSSGARVKFEPREPTISKRSGTNDLIEFLKDVPPPSINGVSGQISNDNGRASGTSTQNSSVAPQSIQESTSSSTALLTSNRKNVNAFKSGSLAAIRAMPTQQDATPTRKQRRVRDPYAIDDSDDDLEEQLTPAQAKRPKDESLIDFLRNTAPPPGSSPSLILAGSAAGSSSTVAAASVKGQSSNQGMRERIIRSASRSSLSRGTNVSHFQAATKNKEPPNYHRSSAREDSPHLSQVGKKIDTYKPTSITHAPHLDRVRTPMKARGPTSSARTDTADLADYLKNSGPPDVPAGAARQSSIVKEEAGFLKFFSRRRAIK